jgi:regulator of sigma E protease
MADVFISLIAFIVAIGILVAVHEWGHFIVARLLGIKVLRFSVGFGKPLWLRKLGPDGTEYCVSAIPVGGYVKLLDERDCEVPPAEVHRAFNRQPVAARVAVLVAGPLLNFIFAVLAYWFMFMMGVPGTKPVVGEIAIDSIAARAGLMEGDTIVRVGDRAVSTWEVTVLGMLDEMLSRGDVGLQVRRADGPEHAVVLRTGGLESELTEPGRLFEVIGISPWAPEIPPVIDEVVPLGSAAKAGLIAGDRIVMSDGNLIETWPEWVDYVRARPNELLKVTVLRNREEVEIDLVVAAVDADGLQIGRIGASVKVPEDLFQGMRAYQRYGPLAALSTSLSRTWEMSALTVRMVSRMVTGDVSVKNISGPINIAQYAGYSARIGVVPFLNFLAIVSISLGILNLLPIPMLDGGQIVYQLAEAAKGSPLSERAQLIGQQMGIAFLLLLMSFAFYNDISRLIG